MPQSVQGATVTRVLCRFESDRVQPFVMSIALGVQRSLIISEHRTGAPGWFESIIDNHLDSKGYTMPVNTQDRNKQPARTGGNCSEMQSEAHNAAKGEQIAQGSGKGDMTPGTGFQCGGNASCAGSKESTTKQKIWARNS